MLRLSLLSHDALPTAIRLFPTIHAGTRAACSMDLRRIFIWIFMETMPRSCWPRWGARPAYVLGSSGGAQIGLNLAARYPERVHTLVAHEPPCVELLPNVEEQRAFNKELREIYKAHGAGAAMQKFMSSTGLDAPRPKDAPPPSPEAQEAFTRVMGNLDFFFGFGMKAIVEYVPDVATLKSGKARVIVGVGEATRGQIAHQTGVALAERLGMDPVIFPGDHGGYSSHPAAFAERLYEVLTR